MQSTSTQHHDGKKLPPGWVRCESAKYGKPYFFDTQTGKSVWFPPETRQPSLAHQHHQPQQQQLPLRRQAEDQEASSPPSAKRPRPSPPPLPSLRQSEGSRQQVVGDSDAVAPEAPAGAGIKVAVIVPYRDLDPAQRRSAHLQSFVPYMEEFLGRHHHNGKGFRVYIVEQSADDGRKFNRGKLLNIGFDLARREECEGFVFHDVDLLPSDELGR